VLFVATITVSGLFSALVLRTPLRWILGGPVRDQQRSTLNAQAAAGALQNPSTESRHLARQSVTR